jgi:hypothetical protein
MRDKTIQWKTIEELRDERERTRAAWETQRVSPVAFLESGQLPDGPSEARRHQEVTNELARRASAGRAPRASAGPQEPQLEPGTPDKPSWG